MIEKNIYSCENTCPCKDHTVKPRLVVITGGPGAGKTAVLEIARKMFCERVAILPESASILFKGGFWRLASESGQKSIQRAIYHVQKELQTIFFEENKWTVGLCDRGTLDGLAYWPGQPEDYLRALGTTLQQELNQYYGVIHLRVPSLTNGYNRQNPVRTETAEVAAAIDGRIHEVWKSHPNYYQISSAATFADKINESIELMSTFLPECCQNHLQKGKL
ncbi:MAG: ATP-binding protein [Pseudobdellovibrio sp.]|nr:ATP-binding protein [Pseudobdellovibrio sp.]